MRLLRHLREDQVWCEFAAAEVDSPRYGTAFENAIGRDAANRLRRATVDSWSDEDRRAARAGVWAIRSGYVAPLFSIGLSWRTARLGTDELADVRLIKFDRFIRIAPSRRLADFVRALDLGEYLLGDDFGENYRRLKPVFDPTRMRGRPILVARNSDEPPTEVEGLTRMSCLLSRRFAGQTSPVDLVVVVGLSPRVVEWVWV